MKSSSFPKNSRLNSSSEINQIRKRGLKLTLKPVQVFRYPNQINKPRIAVAFTKRCGMSVIRNKAKRKVREFFRKNKDALGNYDYLFFSSLSMGHLQNSDWEKIFNKVLHW